MDNNNNNENLTPEQLVEKLREKLAKDRDTYSKIVDDQNDNITVISIDDDDIEELAEIDELEELEEIVESEDITEAEETDQISDSLEQEVFVADFEEVINSTDVTEEAAIEEQEADSPADKTDELVDERVLRMLDQIDVEEDDQEESVEEPAYESSSDKVAQSSDEIEAVENKEQRKPTVYRFRLTYPKEEQTRLNDAVSAETIDAQDNIDDAEQTKLIDVPELQKPDLVVMQTFGATVEHVRNLYGEDVATEYENMLANTDFTERRAAEYEYTRQDQKHDIFMDFKRKMIKFKWKILVSAVLCVLIFLLENLSLVGIKLGGILSAQLYPVSYIMIDLQLLLICAALAFPILKSGFSDLFMLEPTSKSVTAVLVSVAVIIDIVSCFFGGNVVLYNFSAAIALMFSMIAEVVSLKRDYMAFKVLSSDKVKNAAVVTVGTSKTPEVRAYEQLEEDEEVKVVSMQRTKFVKSFFARTKQNDSSAQDKIVIPVALASMVILFVISLVVGSEASVALKIANMSISAIVPFAVYFSICYPISKSSVSLYENGAAIVGNAALDEYSGASIISFEDRDVFPSYCVKLKSVKVYGDSRIDRILYSASSVFSKIGGPLADVFSVSTMEIGCSDNVELVSAAKNGIEAMVDGKRILVGQPEFLSLYGIFVRKDENDTDDYSRMYIAEGDVLCAKFYIKYNLDVDFENVMSRITACGICAVLKTFDPNIDDKMLSSFIDTNKYPIKVVKCTVGEEFGVIHDELDTGIVSTGNAKNTVEATVTSEYLYNMRSSANNVKIVSMIIGFILCAFMAFFKVTPFASIIILGYQLLWAIPALISGKLYL